MRDFIQLCDSRQYLLLRKDILQKTVAGCRCNVDISEQLLYQVKDLVHDSSSLACRNSYCVHHNVSNSLLPLTAFGSEYCLKVMLSFGIKHVLWDTTISGVYHSFPTNSSNMFRKLRKAGKRFVQLRSFIRNPKKTLLQAWKALTIAFFLPTSCSDKHGEKRFWDYYYAQL